MIEVHAQRALNNGSWEVLHKSIYVQKHTVCFLFVYIFFVETLRPTSVHCGLQKALDALAEAK